MLATANSSNLKGRDELKSFFRNRSQLSEQHFAELINAMLNKRDDRFYGVWQEGRTYRKGDMVYYDRSLWEMKAEEEICGRIEEAPGKSPKWTSRLKDLEDTVKLLDEQLKQTQKELQALKQAFSDFKQQVTRFLSLLTLGFGFVFLWLLLSALAHLI